MTSRDFVSCSFELEDSVAEEVTVDRSDPSASFFLLREAGRCARSPRPPGPFRPSLRGVPDDGWATIACTKRSLLAAGNDAGRADSEAFLNPPVTAITLERPSIIRPAT